MSLASFLLMLQARWRLITSTTAVTLIAGLVYVLLAPSRYTASTQLLVDSKAQDPISGQMLPANLNSTYLATQAEVITSRSVALKVIAKLQLEQQLPEVQGQDALVNYLLKGLIVASSRESNLLNIGFSASDPVLAAQIANAIADAYMETNLELRIAPAREISQWYAQQLTQLRANLVDKQNALLAYQQEQGIVVSADKLDLEQEKLGRLSALLTEAQNQRLDKQSLSQQLGNSKQKLLTRQAQDNPQVQKLTADLALAQARQKELASRVGENHPQYRQAAAEVEGLHQQLNSTLELISGSAKNSVALAQNREAQLAVELASQKDYVLQLNRSRNQLTLLQQEVDSAQAAYDAALARANQTQLESRIAQTDVAILNHAITPTHAASPKRAITLLLALFTGLSLGLALALVREWLERPVRSAEELNQALGLAVLATIPAGPLAWPRRGLSHE